MPRFNYASIPQAMENLKGKPVGSEILVGGDCCFIIVQAYDDPDDKLSLLAVSHFTDVRGMSAEQAFWNEKFAKKKPGSAPG